MKKDPSLKREDFRETSVLINDLREAVIELHFTVDQWSAVKDQKEHSRRFQVALDKVAERYNRAKA